MNRAVLAAPLLVGYLSGRFIEHAWLRWSVALLSVIGLFAVWVMRSGLIGEESDGFGAAIVLLLALIMSGELGVVLLSCLVGRSQRLQA